MKTIIEQFQEIDRFPLFEIQVIDRRTNEIEYLIFNINIITNNEEEPTFIMSYPATTQEEEESKYIPTSILNIDNEVSLNSHLEQLYEDCISIIIHSDWYELSED
jgi:hypothetical protein